MRKIAFLASFLLPTTVLLADTAQERLQDAATVLSEVMGTPDRGIPHELLEKARCVMIVPGLKKGAFLVGGEFGRGFVECRQANGAGWGAPAAIRVEGGSFGFQIGGSSTDVIALFMNQRGMDRLMSDKFTVGADASAAAGPVGRTASAATDIELHAEILTWSRSRGAFAGVSLNGAVVRPDRDVNAELYGHKMDTRAILASDMTPPPAARPLISELDRYSVGRERNGTAAREER
jgi:lipid-binding SYLF domain-containing protein